MKKLEILTDPEEIKLSTAIFGAFGTSLPEWEGLTNNLYSRNTLLSYQNDWETFLVFCKKHNVTPLPAAITTVRRFVELTSKEKKVASIRRYVITISLVHRCHSYKDPTRHREVRYTLNRLYQEKPDDATQATAFHIEHLNQLTERFVSSERVKDIRDLLVWTLCFEAMLKRSELSAIVLDDLGELEGIFYLSIGEHTLELSPDASNLIHRWLSLSGIQTGPLFRRINKHGHIGEAPMDHSSIYRVFRRAATELGFEHTLKFSGQSPRVGASQDLANAGMSIKEIQQQGRWKSPAMPAQYVGNREAKETAMRKFKRKLDKD